MGTWEMISFLYSIVYLYTFIFTSCEEEKGDRIVSGYIHLEIFSLIDLVNVLDECWAHLLNEKKWIKWFFRKLNDLVSNLVRDFGVFT